MSNTPVKSEKPEAGSGNKTLDVVEKVLHTLQHKEVPSHKARLHELFALIDKEFDALYEENQELKAKIASLTGHQLPPYAPLKKQGSGKFDGEKDIDEKRRGTNEVNSGPKSQATQETLREKSLAKLRFVKLQKNKVPKQKGPGRKYVALKDFKEHRDGLWEVSSCPWDVGYFATASADHTARICSADGSRASVVYLAHMGSVNSIRFHPVDRLMCTASGDKSCHIWKMPQQSQMKPLSNSADLRNKEASKPRPKPWTPILGDRGDEYVEAGTPGTSPTLTSMNPLLHEPTHTNSRPSSGHFQPPLFPASNPISIPAAVTQSDKYSASHEASPSTELEETANIAESAGNIVVRSALIELKGHTGPVVAASFTSSNSVATGSWDNTVRVWSCDNGRVVANLTSSHDKAHKITNVNTHPSSPIVAFSVTDGTFRIWDYRNAEKPEVVAANQGSPISTAIFTSDGSSILTGGEDRLVKVWDLRNTKAPKTVIRCHSGINRLAVSPISQYIVIPTDGKRSSIYDINGGRVGKFYHYEKSGHKSMVTSAAWSQDESVIFTAGFDRRVVAWGAR
eukprot:Phypoly_transcript_05250.p1 GENE.Phypoly_transcript_05250~~Phypoly_transcript_05250.p1  ORF type:complete len:568 (+),score=73.36 Phypoly_transcript_05250:170-1873(+)